MKDKKIVVSISALVVATIFSGCIESVKEVEGFDIKTVEQLSSERIAYEIPIVVDDNPFYALIATPASLYYNGSSLHVAPLLVENFNKPSKAVERFKKIYPASYREFYGITAENLSIELSKLWKRSDAILLIEESEKGYELGVVAVPLACYLNIPVFVTNNTDRIKDELKRLGVEYTFVCGDLKGYKITWRFRDVEEINDFMIEFLKRRFGGVNYITITNPADTRRAEVLNKTTYEFENETLSTNVLLAQSINAILNGFALFSYNQFSIPDYKYARLSIDLINENSEYVSELGDDLILLVYSPDDEVYVYTSTVAGLPEVKDGDIVVDKVHYETIIYNKPGEYYTEVLGRWIASTSGKYRLKIDVEELSHPYEPLMKNLSSMAPYITSYHKGIIFAKPEFAFAGNEEIGIEGVVYPSTNERLVEPCNKHVLEIHSQLNKILSKIANISDERELRNYYANNPVYVAIMADPTMIPMFYYHNPDSDNIIGVQLPSDFIYGNIDPNPNDLENDTFTYYPFQENAVGRITGYDAQDCSALIARTIFYNHIIDKLGEWKNNATVQTGAGLEFQWIPILTPLSNILSGGNEPTKWPTGESLFINKRLSKDMEGGGYEVKSTHLLASQREGFKDLARYTSRFNILFPNFIEFINGERVKGGEYQRNSNLIFVFNHGIYYLYESGDVILDSLGFPPVTWASRFIPFVSSGLTTHGAYGVRYIVNEEYGPSVIFVESCITGRTDGLLPENCLSQAYLHAGMNAYIGATRVTADPGYIEPGLIFKGFGAKGFVKALIKYLIKGEFPDPHFGAVIAEDFILNLNNNETVGIALRNAKNSYLPKDANSTFLWTPPLTKVRYESGTYLDKKYVCLREFVLYGDPAFNPYQPINKG
ncbi:MAG: C25 family cysteine peptidase [Candidatus Thermoplasmatota archaeon]